MHGPDASRPPLVRSSRRLAALFAAALASASGVASLRAVTAPASDLDVARASVAAVRGRVVSSSATVDPVTGGIYTHVVVDATRTWGFPTPPGRVEIALLGGVVGSSALVIGGQAHFAAGEEVLAFLDRRPRDGSLSVTSLERGKWTIAAGDQRDALASRDLHAAAPDDRRRDAVADVEALAALAGTRVRLPADWTPSSVSVAPIAAADVDVPTQARWHEADWGAAVAVDSAPGGHALFPGGGFAQALRALETWSAAGSLHLVPGTLRTPRCFANSESADGRISIAYDDPCDEIADTSPTLAIGGAYVDLAAQRLVQGVAYGRITKAMVVLDNADAKFAGMSTGCYEEILTHELGHAIGLAHTSAQPSVMAPWLAPSCVERTDSQPLQAADLAAVSARYPAATDDGPPGAPGGLAATVRDGEVRLVWSPAAGAPATSYQVIAGRVPGAGDAGVAVVAVPSLTVQGVARGVYYVRVVAVNAHGASAPSAEVTVIVGDGLPGVPVGLMASAGPAGSVRILWQAPRLGASADAYVLLVGTAPGAPSLRVPLGGTSFAATGVAAGTYFVRAAGVNAAGSGPATPEITVVVP